MSKISEFMKKIKPYILPYTVAIAIPIGVGLLSAFLTKDNMEVYESLNSPPLSPPGLIFPIVWTVLYILMGISSAMIFVERDKNPNVAKKGLVWYGASLILNFSWSIVFFNMQAAFFALLILMILLYSIIKTILEYRKIKPVASYLQIPYVLWVAFAGYLNAGLWVLN